MTEADPPIATPTLHPTSWPPPDGYTVHVFRQYALRAEIASGSVATVYLARLLAAEDFERTVIVRRLRAAYAKDSDCVRRFLGGARRAGAVRHPNVVATLDVVTGGDVMTVAEYVHGESLGALLRTERARGAQTPLPVVSGIFAGVLRGLDAVLALGQGAPDDASARPGVLGARDVMVGVDGVARLMDVVGRPGKEASSPLFGVAAALWEALAGRALPPPAPGGYDPPSRHRAELDPTIDAIVGRGLADEASGFRTPGEMARALEQAVSPASPAQIGAWVESLAHDALAERARLLGEIESAAGALTPPPAAGTASVQVQATAPPGAGEPDRFEVPTRRLRSTPPPAAPGGDSTVDPRRTEGTARRALDAALRGRAAAAGAVLVGATLLLLLLGARHLGVGRAEKAASTTPPGAAAPPAEKPASAASSTSRLEFAAPPPQDPPTPAIVGPALRPGAGPTSHASPRHGAATDPLSHPRRAHPAVARDDVL